MTIWVEPKKQEKYSMTNRLIRAKLPKEREKPQRRTYQMFREQQEQYADDFERQSASEFFDSESAKRPKF